MWELKELHRPIFMQCDEQSSQGFDNMVSLYIAFKAEESSAL
jgi:hypothetical protein